MTIDEMKSGLQSLEPRVRQYAETKGPLAVYLDDQLAIVGRVIAAIEEDRARPDAFFEHEAALEESEGAMLLASLGEELDLIDRNRALSAQSQAKTVNVRDLRAAGDGMGNDGPAFSEAIARAAALGPGARILIPAGRYALEATGAGETRSHLLFDGLSDLTFDAESGTTLVMKSVAGGIVIRNCRNLTLRGFAIDYDPLPFTQGTIVAVNGEANTFDLVIDRGFPAPTLPYFLTASLLRGTVRFDDSGEIDSAGGDPRISHVEEVSPNRYRLTAARNDGSAPPGLTSGFVVGRRFSLHARQAKGAGPGVSVIASQYVTLADVRIHASFDHAYFVRESSGVKLLGCVAEPLPGSDRLACNDADGFHCPSNRKGPLLQDCRFRFVNDDCVNIYSKCHALAVALSPTEQVLDLAAGGGGGEPPRTTLYGPGDAVAFVNPNNGAIDRVARVAGVARAEWRGKSCFALRLDQPVNGLVSRDALGKSPIKGREYVLKQAQGPIEHFVVNLNTKGDGFVIRGCDFGHNRASGIKLKCSNGIFENNRIQRPMAVCLHLLTELSWLEGWAPHNVTIRRNVFDHGRGLVSAYVMPTGASFGSRLIHRIRIEDNEFLNASDFAIRLASAQHVQVSRNRIQSPKPVTLDNCARVKVEGNLFEMPTGAIADGATNNGVDVTPRSDAKTIEIAGNRVTTATVPLVKTGASADQPLRKKAKRAGQ